MGKQREKKSSEESQAKGNDHANLQVLISPTHPLVLLFSQPFLENSLFYMLLKYGGNSGHSLIRDRATKGNGLDTGLMSQFCIAVYKELSPRRVISDFILVLNSFSFLLRP